MLPNQRTSSSQFWKNRTPVSSDRLVLAGKSFTPSLKCPPQVFQINEPWLQHGQYRNTGKGRTATVATRLARRKNSSARDQSALRRAHSRIASGAEPGAMPGGTVQTPTRTAVRAGLSTWNAQRPLKTGRDNEPRVGNALDPMGRASCRCGTWARCRSRPLRRRAASPDQWPTRLPHRRHGPGPRCSAHRACSRRHSGCGSG